MTFERAAVDRFALEDRRLIDMSPPGSGIPCPHPVVFAALRPPANRCVPAGDKLWDRFHPISPWWTPGFIHSHDAQPY